MYHTLPIVSLVADPDTLWNEDYGMLSVGGTLVKEAGKLPFKFADGTYPNYRTYGKEQHEGHVEYYFQDKCCAGAVLIRASGFGHCRVSTVSGHAAEILQSSAPNPSTGLRPSQLSCSTTGPIRSISPSCCAPAATITCSPVPVDGFRSRLMDAYGTQVIHQAWNPVVVYLNGAYLGAL